MLAGGLNQRIRENSYFFTIIYFTGSGEQREGFEKRKLAIEEGALGIGHWALVPTGNRQQSTVK